MISTYYDYLNMPQYLTTEKMIYIHLKMQEEIGEDPDALEIYEDLLKAATKYSNMRAMWATMKEEEKRDQDALRTAYHDSLIMNINMLARYLRAQGRQAEWRRALGPEPGTEGYDRKAIGDFGCYLAFVSGLCAR